MPKKIITSKQKEFAKVKRFVQKRAPGARTILHADAYTVVDGSGKAIVQQELMLPNATSVKMAWEQARYSLWFSNMMRKNNNAFSDEKIFKKIAKESGDSE
jgi:hypothetical protein